MRRIFLSYSGKDKKLADEFDKELQKQAGIEVFKADRSIALGDEWQDGVETALDNMDAFVALVSPSWNTSPWCKKEHGVAKARRVTIVPVPLTTRAFDLPIMRLQGITALGNKAIARCNGRRREVEVSRAVKRIRDALAARPQRVPDISTLLEYAMPGVSARRPPLIVYHCGSHTGEEPSGKRLKEALEELLGSEARTAEPVLHDVTKKAGPPDFKARQTVFVVDSPTANPVAREVLLNYQRYMVGTKVHHITTLDRGIQVQTIWSGAKSFCSNRHRVALDDRDLAEGFDDYLVIMRLPGIVLSGDFSEEAAQRTVWLVYGTTYRGSFAGATLFSRDNFRALFTWLCQRSQEPPAAFQAIFHIPSKLVRATWFEDLVKPEPHQVIASLQDRVRGDPVPTGLGAALLDARDVENYSGIPISAAHVDLVAACNYNCGLCIEKEIRKKNCRLSHRKALSILRDLRAQGCRDLSFYGGEPTLHPQFVEIAKYATRLGFHPLVVTNGSMLTHRDIFEGLKRLAGKARLRISMDANSQAAYARHHGLKNMNYRFDRIRDAVLALAHYVDISISYLVTKDNVNELAAAMEFWRDSPVTAFNPRIPMGKHGCWLLTDKYSDTLRRKLRVIPWKRYPPDWLIVPDWLHDWIRDGSKPNAVWGFSRCYSAFYRIGISPGLDTTPEQTGSPGDSTDTKDAWLSLCPYHRYEKGYGCEYPRNLGDWCKHKRAVAVDRIRPYSCETEDKVVCSRVAHNTTVQAEINR